MSNISPWITQLNRTRPADKLNRNLETDIAVIGAGIAGVTTAYYILKNTKYKVALIEADRVAHGATGHNAGQVVSYFERPLQELVAEFGLEMTGKAQSAIESTWELLEGIINEAKLQTPVSQFTGYAGYCSLEQIIQRLNDSYLRGKMGLALKPMMISEESGFAEKLPERFVGLYNVIKQRDILALLETNNTRYHAVMSSRKGCTNSAMISEELVGFMASEFSNRFILAEETPVNTLVLQKDLAVLMTDNNTVTAKRVVLCTNGFENINIENQNGLDIDGRYHEDVRGIIGYMSGYLTNEIKNPTAVGYFSDEPAYNKYPYFYLTRRAFEYDNESKNLICIGGPEDPLDEKAKYSREHLYPSKAQKELDSFLKSNYVNSPQGEIDYRFQWHGLMGYTKNRIRMIGEEPCNNVLLYNLGCNGVGILPSIYGGKKISDILAGIPQVESIFDIRDLRCYIKNEPLVETARKEQNKE